MFRFMCANLHKNWADQELPCVGEMLNEDWDLVGTCPYTYYWERYIRETDR